MRAQFAILPDGRRHFHDGPIDLILQAWGARADLAYEAAAARFATLLDELCRELPRLRTAHGPEPQGVVARRMTEAVAPFAATRFLTPMAAVAGAVAEEVLAAMTQAARLERAYVNNGGDIALHLIEPQPPSAVPSPLAGEGQGEGAPPQSPSRANAPSFTLGMVARPDRPSLLGEARITANDPVRGVATSGWRGRSFSLGIADAVTVLARTAAEADAAATLIANAVDLPGHPAVARAPARSRDPQSDLGDRLVTLQVGSLSEAEIAAALAAGAREARHWRALGLIEAAALSLAGRIRLVGAESSLYTFPHPAVPEPRRAQG